MFGKKSADYAEAERVMEDLARSFLRGSIHGTPEARNRLGDRLAELAGRLSPVQAQQPSFGQTDFVILSVMGGGTRTNS